MPETAPMMPILLSAALIAASLAPLPAAMATATIAEHGDAATRAAVVAAIDAWRNALIAGDRAGLDRAYHEDLSYGHSDGVLLSKREQIDRSIEPGRSFTAVDIADLTVRSYGPVAYVTATWTFRLRKDDGTTSASTLASLDVWTKSARGWQLIARQLVRPATH
jgi:ketosteroid isomerase-like protein